MVRHTITHADQLFVGNGVKPGINDSKRGLPWTPLVKVNFGVPAVADGNGYVAAAAVAAAGAVTLNGALVSSGVGQSGALYGRRCQCVSSNAGDTTQVVTITGVDGVGDPVVEEITLNGTTVAGGLKAFKTVISISVSAALAGTLDVGTNDALGLPYRFGGKSLALRAFVGGVDELATTTLVSADSTDPATATSGDPRGVWDPVNLINGSDQHVLWYRVSGYQNNFAAFGADNYAG